MGPTARRWGGAGSEEVQAGAGGVANQPSLGGRRTAANAESTIPLEIPVMDGSGLPDGLFMEEVGEGEGGEAAMSGPSSSVYKVSRQSSGVSAFVGGECKSG